MCGFFFLSRFIWFFISFCSFISLLQFNLVLISNVTIFSILKTHTHTQIQYKLIDLTDCGLNDASATALFDIIEYYEAANEIDISENRNITNRGWQACINMVKRSHALQILVTRGTPLSESNAISLGKSMLSSSLNTLKLEHCGLSGRPMASLCKISISICYFMRLCAHIHRHISFIAPLIFSVCIFPLRLALSHSRMQCRYLLTEKYGAEGALVGAQRFNR